MRKKKRDCYNCKYEEVNLWEEPCKSCWIPDKNKPDPRDNDKWEPKEKKKKQSKYQYIQDNNQGWVKVR